jgi:hypothetical protein
VIVEPRRRWWVDGLDGRPVSLAPEGVDEDELKTIPSRVADGLFIECEVTHPPSAVGRRVTLRVAPERADAFLRELRDYGVARRRASS